MTTGNPLRRWFVALVTCAIAVGLCMAYVDRPVADFVQAHLRHTRFCFWTERVLQVVPVVLLLALALLFIAGCLAVSGHALGAWARTPLVCSWSAVWALSTAVVLKRIVGRASVDPNYIVGHFYGFQFLHGVGSYEAFPSGTTAVSAAMLSVLWFHQRHLRAVWAVVLALIAMALVVTHSHWVSDILAGGFLGGTTGWLSLRLLGDGREVVK